MAEPDACLAYITCGSRDEALSIARSLLERRLAAAANLLGPGTSLFHWQGAVHEAEEWVLVLKSRPVLAERLVEHARTLHSYACPGILILPVLASSRPYLEWLGEETLG